MEVKLIIRIQLFGIVRIYLIVTAFPTEICRTNICHKCAHKKGAINDVWYTSHQMWAAYVVLIVRNICS